MKYLAVLKLVIGHAMFVLFDALWSISSAVGASAIATWTAWSTGHYTLAAYWTVTMACGTGVFALLKGLRGKDAADAEPPLMPRIRALLA